MLGYENYYSLRVFKAIISVAVVYVAGRHMFAALHVLVRVLCVSGEWHFVNRWTRKDRETMN